MAIHQRHLELVLVVGDRANTANDGCRASPPRVIDQQPVERVDLDVRILGEHFANDRDPLLRREQRLLFLVDEHRHQDALEQMRAAQNDVDVAVRQRIERAGKNRETTVWWIGCVHGWVACSDASALMNMVNVLSPDLTSRTRASVGGTSGSMRVARSRTSNPSDASRPAALSSTE